MDRFVAKFIGSSNWVDERRMFRPEKAQLTALNEADEFTAEAVSVQFLGSNYQVQLKHGGNVWSFLSPQRMQVGTKVSIYIKQSDMITF